MKRPWLLYLGLIAVLLLMLQGILNYINRQATLVSYLMVGILLVGGYYWLRARWREDRKRREERRKQ